MLRMKIVHIISMFVFSISMVAGTLLRGKIQICLRLFSSTYKILQNLYLKLQNKFNTRIHERENKHEQIKKQNKQHLTSNCKFGLNEFLSKTIYPCNSQRFAVLTV